MNKLILFILIVPCISEIHNLNHISRIPVTSLVRHDNNLYKNKYNNGNILNSNSVIPSPVRRVQSPIKSQPCGSLLPLNRLSRSASDYLDSIKILLTRPWLPAVTSTDLKLIFIRGLIAPAFILYVITSADIFNYLEKIWIFQGEWNGLTTKDLAIIALSLHLAHSLFKLLVLRVLFISNLSNLRCPIKNLFFPVQKSLLARIVQSNQKTVSDALGLFSVGLTAASFYAGLILSNTAWGTSYIPNGRIQTYAYLITFLCLIKSFVLNKDFASWVNIKHFITPLKFRNSIRKSYLISKLFMSTANLPKEYQLVFLSQNQINILWFINSFLRITSFVLKFLPTSLETISMLLLFAINISNLSLAGLIVSLVHAITLFIENIIFYYDKSLLVKDLDAIYNRS